MGGKLSADQDRHYRELRELTKQHFLSKRDGSLSLKKAHLKELLIYIWKNCPSYPETGSLRTETWRELGTCFHTSPRAPPQVLIAWKAVMKSLDAQEQLLLRVLAEPPACYKEGVPKLAPALPPDALVVATAPTAPKLSGEATSLQQQDKPQEEGGTLQLAQALPLPPLVKEPELLLTPVSEQPSLLCEKSLVMAAAASEEQQNSEEEPEEVSKKEKEEWPQEEERETLKPPQPPSFPPPLPPFEKSEDELSFSNPPNIPKLVAPKKLYSTCLPVTDFCYQPTCNPVNLTFLVQQETSEEKSCKRELEIPEGGAVPPMKSTDTAWQNSLDPATPPRFHACYKEFGKQSEL